MKFEILIPEIKLPRVQELIKSNAVIGDLSPRDQKMLVSIAIEKLNAFYNYNVINMNNQEEEESKMPIWIGGLSSIRTRSLFSGLVACITGQTEYVNMPPPNVISFRKVCVGLTDAFMDAFPVEAPKPTKSSMPSEERIKMMKEMLPPRFWPKTWYTEHTQSS